MRGPPPNWQPPCPPERGHDYENNYEDPANLDKHGSDEAEDLLLNSGPPPMYNSYEMSVSQQRRSNAMSSSGNDSLDDAQSILLKNAQGAYFIPGGSLRSTPPILPQARYQEECPSSSTRKSSKHRSTSSLLKFSTSASLTGTSIINKKRSSKMLPFNEKSDFSNKRPSIFTIFLCLALLVALCIIIVLAYRRPYYVYMEQSPASTGSKNIAVDPSILRPLPARVEMNENVDVDMLPSHIAETELFVPKPSRIVVNVTMDAGAKVILLGRHNVPPSLYHHDFLVPLRLHKDGHVLWDRRVNKDQFDYTEPRMASVEEFLVEGRWHLMFINDRNRVESLSFHVSSQSSQSTPKLATLLVCEQGCSGHGECVNGKCRCVRGYDGETCSDAICPIVCSGNGVFSGGKCVCDPGFKGSECDIRSSWCENPDCNGNGICGPEGNCVCRLGFSGSFCEKKDCVKPKCSSNGVCSNGTCFCANGWTGADCSEMIKKPISERYVYTTTPVPTEVIEERLSTVVAKQEQARPTVVRSSTQTVITTTPQPCSFRGTFDGNICICKAGWTGTHCEQETCVECLNGKCESGKCSCFAGWIGEACDVVDCPVGCSEKGNCLSNGTCVCKEKGFNLDNCFIDGCPNGCSQHGECTLQGSDWHCNCKPGRTGPDCSVAIEVDCSDGYDNDNNDLTDCDDPSCCSSDYCREQGSCVYSPTPSDVLLPLPPIKNPQFSQKIAFLHQSDIQKYSDATKFNESLVSVVRGRIVWTGGSKTTSNRVKLPLAGVRVSEVTMPLWGFTLSRLDGEFDLVVNGGQTIQLRFQRNPFTKIVKNIYVSPNRVVHVGDVLMNNGKSQVSVPRVKCSVISKPKHNPTILPSWKFGSYSALQSGMALDTRSLTNRLRIPDSSIFLTYDSSRVPASKSWIVFGLLSGQVDPDLRVVHVEIEVAGSIFIEKLAPTVNLTHVWSWDRQNVYRQSEHGLVQINVRIGYEYTGCDHENEVEWITRVLKLEGAHVRQLEGNGWSLDIHHYLDTVNNVLELGTGGKQFISESSFLMSTFLGNGTKRSVECSSCSDIDLDKATLLRPTCIATGNDGSVFIGDNELIRRVDNDGHVTTLLKLSIADASHSYQLAVNPINGALYVSLSLRKQIWKVSSFTPTDVSNNYEVIAGDGLACSSHEASCGDGSAALSAQLLMPKGIAFDAEGTLFVADGRRIRIIDSTLVIRSLGIESTLRPPQCANSPFPLSFIQLEWPTSISVHLPSGRLYVLDSNRVYQLNPRAKTATLVLGVSPACSNGTTFPLRFAKDITVGSDESILVVESDGRHLNRLSQLSADRRSLNQITGIQSTCSCDSPQCDCDSSIDGLPAKNAKLNNPVAVAISSTNVIYIVDNGNAKIKKLYPNVATYNPRSRHYTVVNADSDELYAFNRHGLHLWTQSLVTGKTLYNFTYTVETSLGRLSSVHGAGGLIFRLLRVNDTHITIESPSGARSQLSLSVYDSSLESVDFGHGEFYKFHYSTGGLLLTQSNYKNSFSATYDSHNRLQVLRKEGEMFNLLKDEVSEGHYISSVMRNLKKYASVRLGQLEVSFENSLPISLKSMGDSLFLSAKQSSVRFVAFSHPSHDENALLKSKATVPSITNPGRRELTYHFDWSPYVKKDTKRRVAQINGHSSYSITLNRSSTQDVVRSRLTEDELLIVSYDDSGDITAFEQPCGTRDEPDVCIPKLSISMTSPNTRTISWGILNSSSVFDRQNRLVEYSTFYSAPLQFTYVKDFQQPSSILVGNETKFNIKLDSRGKIKDIVTPLGAVHSFNQIFSGKESILQRRYPFSKKSFQMSMDTNGLLTDWVTVDGLHQKIVRKDAYGRINQMLCDGSYSTIDYDEHSRLSSIATEDYSENITWQGPLISIRTLKFSTTDKPVTSSFSYEYDDHFRVIYIHSNIEGLTLEPIRVRYDETSGRVSDYSGYQILRKTNVMRLQGHKLMYENTVDAYRRVKSTKIIIGDVRVDHKIVRDMAGRVSESLWTTPWGVFNEYYQYDVTGRMISLTNNNERYLKAFNMDGFPVSVNDNDYEYHTGGVAKKANNQNYVVDGNGWVIRRGEISFEYDCEGRLLYVRTSTESRRFFYDNQGRLNRIIRGKETISLFYTDLNNPHRITFFFSSLKGPGILYWTDDNTPFTVVQNGFRYVLATDSRNSLSFVFSEAGLIKRVTRDINGKIVFDSDEGFWLPLGYLGGVDIPEFSLSIINGRPFDTTMGRYLSFGPDQMKVDQLVEIVDRLDLFALEPFSRPHLPLNVSDWFYLIGLDSSLVPVLPTMSVPDDVIFLRSLSYLPKRTRMFSTPLSQSPSFLVTKTRSPQVRLSSDIEGFSSLFMLIPLPNTTLVETFPLLSLTDKKLLSILFDGAVEMKWHFWRSSLERHFYRKTVSKFVASESRAHFTIVVNTNKIELRSGKDKIVIHIGQQHEVEAQMDEELRKSEGPSVWRGEKKRVERNDSSSRKWTESQRWKVLEKGAVDGYDLFFKNPLNARFPSIHQWSFAPSRKP